jgi:DNA polymerase III subunit delta
MAPAHLIKGDDPSLISEALTRLLGELVGDTDPGLAVEDWSGEEVDLAAVVDSCQTPPFLTARRVVVLRDVGRFGADDVAPLMRYLADPLETTALVLVTGAGGRAPKKLEDVVKQVGQVVEAGAPQRATDRRQWYADRLDAAPVRLDRAATALLEGHLGEDLGRLSSLLDVLVAAYGDGARIGPDELAPFLGQAGGVAPWDLTDAIDRGDADTALAVLHRMLAAGERHPLVIMATLQRHYGDMLRLDGSAATSEAEAAEVLGVPKGKSTFRARKTLDQTRVLGSAGVARAVSLLATADLDLRGARAWPDELVLEVLVGRLARLNTQRRRRPVSGKG